MNSFKSILGAVLAAALVTGCGGLDSPDLGTGQVSGRLTGNFKKGAAFAYALGKPETKVLVGDDGSYTLEGVPVASNGNVPDGKTQVVLFDGETRADVHVADVKPASRTRADDRDASTLATARSVVAAARCSGGASGSNTVYSVDGAALRDEAKGDFARLFPLPPGVFKVRAKLSGFKEKIEEVDLTVDADKQLELELELDDADEHRGCLANGCTDGRECDDDGQCYACTGDGAPCGAGFVCDHHVCVPEGGARHVCAPCTGSSQCEAPSGRTALCIGPAGSGVCSHTCATGADCPPDFVCSGGACVAPSGCAAYFAEFGSSCLNDTDCALADPRCVKRSGSTVGQCTAKCSSNADCPESLGYSCDTSNSVCVK